VVTAVVAVDALQELREEVARFLSRRADLTALQGLIEAERNYDPAVWKRMAAELQLQGIAVSEAHGGQGFGFVEQAVVIEELGRVLYSGPYLASAVLGAAVLSRANDSDLKRDWLGGVVTGEKVVTLAVSEESLMWTADQISTTAAHDVGTAYRVSGTKTAVVAGGQANAFLVVARDSHTDELLVLVVDAQSEGVDVTERPALDLTRRFATVRLDQAPAHALTFDTDGEELILGELNDLAGAALAAEQVGAASGLLELTLEYARRRIQFGREIGSFQAVRHRLADLYSTVQVATAATRHAVRAVETGAADRAIAAATARSVASEAFKEVAEAAIQLHGGIGFTWEHPCHLYFKRAKASELLLGTPSAHRRRLHQQLHGW
jgi:alkylation response protein AidB-like acyl-CoA dehydrogenase